VHDGTDVAPISDRVKCGKRNAPASRFPHATAGCGKPKSSRILHEKSHRREDHVWDRTPETAAHGVKSATRRKKNLALALDAKIVPQFRS
jgi:hypothetical protein